jgi:hypothetical protein
VTSRLAARGKSTIGRAHRACEASSRREEEANAAQCKTLRGHCRRRGVSQGSPAKRLSATPMRPKGSGGPGASAADANYAWHNWRVLLDDVQATLGLVPAMLALRSINLRRTALHLPAPAALGTRPVVLLPRSASLRREVSGYAGVIPPL